MPRPVLGRGLDSLLHGGKGGSPSAEAVGKPSEAGQLPPGPGVEKLLRGSTTGNEPVARPRLPATTSTAPPRPGSLTWSLILADLLLAALAAYIVFLSPRPLKPVQTMLCIVALALGAWLSCMALLWKPREQQHGGTPDSGHQNHVDSGGQ